MSRAESADGASGKKEVKNTDFPEDEENQEELPADPEASELVKEALVSTGKLCGRVESDGAVQAEDLDTRHAALSAATT